MAKSQSTNVGGASVLELDAKGLLDTILDNTKPANQTERDRNQEFIKELVKQALEAKPGTVFSSDLEKTIKKWQSDIDRKLSAQVNEIMHHPDFQQIEGTWRGLDYLVKQSETGTALKIKVLNVSKKTLAKDLERASEFDQSILFKKIYESEYGTLGGSPYGLIVGDYEFGRHPEDIEMLKKISGVAASAHAPFIAATAASMFNLEEFTELNNERDLSKQFEGPEFTTWRSFRDSEDSRYVALAMPRVLGRLPYGPETKRVEEFNFVERVDQDHKKYLWMNAAWAYAARTTDAFAKDGWFMRTRGVEGGGKIEGLPVHVFEEDGGKTMKCPTEVLIPDRRENELSELGFLPLLHCKNTDFAAFLGSQSAQKPKKYFDNSANANAEMSTKFNYLMCVSRFSHYLKVIARDKVGAMMEASDLDRMLKSWIDNYVHPDPANANEEIKAKCPLREASINVTEVKGKPGWYQVVAHLRPHYQLEGIDASMRLVAELPQAKK
ncbi:MAG TPA: type VI secretion system contractile sheath large subunit [Gemmatales bacterium]|nr:type VI secretion system contractile sheath large subunit [Gemmatales bacterium]